MNTLKQQFIIELVRRVTEKVGDGNVPKIMDLGCGTASYLTEVLKVFPNIEYVGVEPIADSFAAAKKTVAGIENARVHFQLGYEDIPEESEGSFDLVFSLSVLEHVKQLDKFIALSAKYAKGGGMVIHRYDLGHALTPHSLKERFHVFLGNNFPQVLPETKFVRYVGVPEVETLYRQSNLVPTDTTYHQMPSHKSLEKAVVNLNTKAIEDLFAWEMKYQSDFRKLPVAKLESLFPAVTVWGEKN